MRLEPKTVFGATYMARTVLASSSGTDTALNERGDVGCLLVNCAVEVACVAEELARAAGLSFPAEPGGICTGRPGRALWLTPRSWLLQCPVDQEYALATVINERFPDKRVHAALFTDYLCWFELSGAEAWNVLTAECFLTLDRKAWASNRVKRTRVAGIATVVLQENPNTWLLGVERSRAVYFAESLRSIISRLVTK